MADATITLPRNPAYKEGGLLAYSEKNGKVLPVQFEYTRSTGAYTYKREGFVNVPANTPRVQKDGSIVFEPQRTNSIRLSEDVNPDNSSHWYVSTLGTGLTPIVTSNYGTYLGQKTHRVQCEVSDLDNASRSYISGLVDPVITGVQWIWARSLNGKNQVCTLLGSASNDTTITPEWQRFEFAVSGASEMRIGILDTGSNNPSDIVDIEVSMPSQEDGAYPTTYIPTNGSSVTRDVSQASITGVIDSDLIGLQSGLVYLHLEQRAVARDTASNAFQLGGNNNRLYIYNDGAGTDRYMSAYVHDTAGDYTGFRVDQDEVKFAFNIKSTGVEIWANGSKVATSGAFAFTGLDQEFRLRGEGRELILKGMRVERNAGTDQYVSALTTI